MRPRFFGFPLTEQRQRALDRQKAKLQKAKDKGKPEVYIAYKAGKVEFTKSLLKTAILVQNLKKAGLM